MRYSLNFDLRAVISVVCCALIAQSAGAANHALLVGVTKYDNFDEKKHLYGPGNDAALFREVLADFEFKDENIVSLTEAVADGKPAQRPTRANILREFAATESRVQAGDQLVLYMGGHGSRQIADEDPNDPEPDGLDEVFLPADVGANFNYGVQKIENAISDDEIGAFLTAVRSKGAFVWFVADFCHSGTASRSAEETIERSRKLPLIDFAQTVEERAQLRELMVQAEANATPLPSLTRGAATHQDQVFEVIPEDSNSMGGIVVMSAAQPEEQTPEKPMPRGGKTYGLFTYTLIQALKQSPEGLSYNDLADKIYLNYRAMGRVKPTPVVEGNALNRQVLGLSEWPDQERILIRRQKFKKEEWIISAGQIRGLNIGSILEVFPPAGAKNADQSVGYVRVIEAQPLVALVVPHAYQGKASPAAESIQVAGRLVPAFIDYGDQSVRIALQERASAEEQPILVEDSSELESAVHHSLTELSEKRGNLIQYVDTLVDADWVLTSEPFADRIVLQPASEALSAEESSRSLDGVLSNQPGIRKFACEIKEGVVVDLDTTLSKIARAHCLMNLGTSVAASAGSKAKIRLRLEVLQHAAKEDLEGTVVDFSDVRSRTLQVGNRYSFRVYNEGSEPADATLLFVDAHFGITPLLARGVDNRVQPSQSIQSRRFRVSDSAIGPEQLIAIAVRGDSVSPLDMSYLAQPSLERSRSVPTRGDPIRSLFNATLFGESTGASQTRGLPASEVKNLTIEVLPWITVK